MRGLLCALTAAAVIAGCSSNDSGSEASGGTSAGSAGAPAGGSSGAGGSGGSLPNSGGSSGAASGGTAGAASGGSAGTAGSGGAGGSGGSVFVKPTLLSETGLYQDVVAGTLANGVRAYEPQYALWSDTAAKLRYVYLPEGTTIDTTDMSFWKYPIGTKLWKEFSRDGVRIETRLIQKTDESDWYMVSFKWREDGTDADAVPDGESDSRGTPHDIPNQKGCRTCHENMPERVLGFSAVQLSHTGEGVTLQTLMDEGRLSAPPAAPLTLPGTPDERAVLGYLHGNCGNCHNSESNLHNTVDLELWANTDQLGSVAETPAYVTSINQPLQASNTPLEDEFRIVPGHADESALYRRMSQLKAEYHMPPLGTEMLDEPAIDLVEAWIDSMPEQPTP